MFERYTEGARRVVYYARQEASRMGGAVIEPERLLPGLLLEEVELAERFQERGCGIERVRERTGAGAPARTKAAPAQELGLSGASRRVRRRAAGAAAAMGQREVETGHLAAALPRECGLE